MNNEKLIDNIKSICKNNNITITKLEEELGMSQGLISRWTKSDPSLSRIVDIADYFHVSLDEVVGYRNTIIDKFLDKLITQTADKTIKWHKYDNSDENQPRKYTNYDELPFVFTESNNLIENKELSYYVQINDFYISIYGNYAYNNIINPSEIKLFIQPGGEAQLIEQTYSYEQLKVLWLKILYTLGENAPDEIKAEEFKNSFISDFKKQESPKKKKNIIFVTNPPNSKTQLRQQSQRKNVVLPVADLNQLNPKVSESISNAFKNVKQTEVDSNNHNESQTEE